VCSVILSDIQVEGDGRLVPATDDEVMQVEDFLEDDKSEMQEVADGGQTVRNICNGGSSPGKIQLESSGLLVIQLLLLCPLLVL
jgi:hypothetical protein